MHFLCHVFGSKVYGPCVEVARKTFEMILIRKNYTLALYTYIIIQYAWVQCQRKAGRMECKIHTSNHNPNQVPACLLWYHFRG